MRYSFVPSPDSPPNLGKLVEDETGDLIGFGTFYKTAIERDTLKERVERLEAALQAFLSATEAGVQGGLVNMSRLKGRVAFKGRIDAARAQAAAALTNDAGEGA